MILQRNKGPIKYKGHFLQPIIREKDDRCKGCFFWNLSGNELGNICRKLRSSDLLPSCDIKNKELIFTEV